MRMSSIATRLSGIVSGNPMINKELSGRMRSGRSTILLTIYLSLLAGFAFLYYWIIYSSAQYRGPYDQGVGRDLLSGIVVFETLLVLFLAPAVTAGAISGERERQTFDLLMTTLLKPRAIILGKMGAALAFLLLLILAVAPFESLAFMVGGVAPEEIIVSLLVLVCTALVCGSIGIFWSSLMKSTAASTVLTYGTVVMVLAGLPFLWFVITLVVSTSVTSSGGSFQPGPLYTYFSGFILSTDPIVAMGFSEAFVRSGKDLFWFTDNTIVNGHTLWFPQPWLVFCLTALIVATVLLALSIRVLPPVRRHRARRQAPVVTATIPGAGVPGAVPPPPVVELARVHEDTPPPPPDEGVA
jgi:ABC-type transport system involved in multi-copper enzyme maturation permease subunit